MTSSLPTCQQLLACAARCVGKRDIPACQTSCAMMGSPIAQQQFLALMQCIYSFCVLDASAVMIGTCTNAALADPNKCAVQAQHCQ
jgi:hypothetical protein